MTDNPKSTFARRVRAARPRPTKYEVRDDVVSGLALAIQPTGVRTYFFSRMVRGRRRYATIGSADVMTIPEARREARGLIASYIEPTKKDSGARTPGHPMTAFAEEFLDRQAHRWKPRTVETNSRIVRDPGRHCRRACQGLVRVHGRPARQRQPRPAGPVRHDAHGRALGLPPPQLQSLQEDQAIPDAAEGAVSDKRRKWPGSTPY